jgi:hypothetical protein
VRTLPTIDTNHYADTSDSPARVDEGSSAWTRNLDSIAVLEASADLRSAFGGWSRDPVVNET